MEMPAISVIIPMYNAERYVRECLDSFLAQTFTDFEIIVVDDCSTDSSRAIVESYAPRFNGRLTLAMTQKNSGNSGYTARNKGFNFSRGEYVYFADADDFVTKTALEELYTAAKEADADVVYTGARYLYTAQNGVELKHDIFGRECLAKGIKEVPELITDNAQRLLELFIFRGGYWTAWTKFVRRNFLTENEITFYEVPSGGDFLWSMELLCCVKRLLRIPNAVYLWRDDSNESMTRSKKSTYEQIARWFACFSCWAKFFTALSKKRKILEANPAYIYFASNRQFEYFFKRNFEARLQVDSEKIFEILTKDFAEKNLGADSTMPFLFSVIDSLQKNLIVLQQQNEQLAAQAQKRIAELEKRDRYNKSYIAELEKFVADSQRRITALEGRQ